MPGTGDWREIEELYFAAEEMTPLERAAFLDERCAGRDDLRRKVERLLAAAETESDLVAEVVGRAAKEVHGGEASVDGSVAKGQRFGPYRLLEVVGQGGMGTVFRAERDDGEFAREVAIKIIREGLARGDARRRFLQERQILARLDHPAVARLLDGGTTAEGHPYLVMEYVKGLPVDRYCDHHRLPIRRRLELFREICEAVHDAHGDLVVHRDLKPSNILVTEEGRPKLLDFGISKLLDEGAEAPAETTLGHRVLTPEFASPEQLRDQPITTAVDIYALGLLLHRLLTGTGPYPVTPSSGIELRRAICEVEAERPSVAVRKLAGNGAGAEGEAAAAVAAARGTTAARLPKLLAGDLDHIVAKALRKEPRERYRSVDRLSTDVGRHLDGLPVEARRGGLRYRAGRFVRRHRTAVAATGAALLALTLGLVGQAREAQRANREALVSAQVVEFLTDLFDASDPTETLDATSVADLLHRAVQRVGSELEGQPLVQARLMSTLARVYHNRGLFGDALPLAQGVLERRSDQLPARHPDIATAHLDVADNLRVLGRMDEAMPHYEKALELRRRHFGEASLETAQVLNNTALNLIRRAELAPAKDLLTEVLAIRRRAPGQEYMVAQTLHNLALIANRTGDYAGVQDLTAESLAIKAEVLPENHPSKGRTLALRAGAQRELGEYAEAEAALRQALEIFRGAWDETHLDVLAGQGDLAELRHLQGDVEGAEAEQRRVLAAKREHLGEEHGETALTYAILASQLKDQGRLEEAVPLLERSLQIRRNILREGHPTIGLAMLTLADTLRSVGRSEEALALAREGLPLLEAGLPGGHPRLAKGRRILAACRAAAEPGTKT